jgi:hypothetical protein
MKKIIFYFLSIIIPIIIAIPVLAADQIKDFKTLVNTVFIGGILGPIVPLLIGLGVVVFIYGVLILMFSEGGEKKEDGKKFMLWGIIGIFVMVSVWGLVAVLTSTFNLDNTAPTINIKVPTV